MYIRIWYEVGASGQESTKRTTREGQTPPQKPSDGWGKAAEIPDLSGKTREEADVILRNAGLKATTNNPSTTPGGYTKYTFDDGSYIWIGPDGEIDRLPKQTKETRGWRIDPTTGDLVSPHTFPPERLK